MKQEEKQIIEKVLKGDTSSFGYFVSTYQDMAYTIAFRITRNKQDAEDIVQNAFVRTFHNLHSFRFTSKFSTWFYRIVYNTALSELQQSFFTTEFTGYEEASLQNSYSSDWNGLENLEESERKKIINKVLDLMSKEESLILTLFYLEENSIKDVALMIGLSEPNVKVRLHRARKKFSELIGTYNLCETLKYYE